MENKECLKMQQRATKIIPGMTQLLSKRPDKYCRGVWPTYFKKAKGVEVVDLDGNKYLDFSIGGVGATVLGYADEDVNNAVKNVIDLGSASTLNPYEEVNLAEKLIELHPWADMARFARSGGEAMAVAVRIARTGTQKDVIVFCGYHGWMDWYLAANLGGKDELGEHWIGGLSPNGVPKGLKGTAIPFVFNDIKSFKEAIEKAGDNLAAVVMEPIRNYTPDSDFIDCIHKTVKENGVPLIIDEISAGFRICNGGAHLKLGLDPDIAVFSKALGNGYPSSAVIGKEWIMKSAQDAFITSTNWTERVGAVAALAMINNFVKNDASTHLLKIGDMVQEAWQRCADKNDIKIHIGGFNPMLHFSFEEGDHMENIAYFTQEMLEEGFLASASFYSMFAHQEEQVLLYEKAVDKVFAKLSKLIKSNTVKEHLIGEPVVAGFVRIN